MMLLLLCCLCFVHCSLCPLCCCWMDVGLGWPGLHLCLTLTPPEMQLRAIPLTLYLSVPSRSLCTSPPRLAASPLTTDTTLATAPLPSFALCDFRLFLYYTTLLRRIEADCLPACSLYRIF